jgi:hypothetical protein
MVREGRVLISVSGDPDFASGYSVQALEVGAQVVSAAGATVTVRAGHGFAAGDKYMKSLDVTTYSGTLTVQSVTATTVVLGASPSWSLSSGDLLINLGGDTSTAATPNYDGNGLAVYTDMAYGSQATNNTVTTDSNGRYRYYHRGVAIWELVRSGSALTALYIDTGHIFSSPINVMDFGARGDGTTDDSVAIQAAIDAAVSTNVRHLYVPRGNYKHTVTLNFTSIFGFHLEGATGYGTAAKFISQTGARPAFDFTGANDCKIENIWIDGTVAGTPCKTGILLARRDATDPLGVLGCEFMTFHNVSVKLLSDYAANGGAGTIAFYCYGAEIGSMHDCRMMADNGIVFTRSNLYSQTSAFVTIEGTSLSMTQWDLDGAMKVSGGKGSAITFNDTHNIYFRGYISRLDDPGVSPNRYALRFLGEITGSDGSSLGINRMATCEGNYEYYDQAAYIDSNLDNCNFNVIISPKAAAATDGQFVFSGKAAAYARNNQFRLNPANIETHYLIDMATGSPSWGFAGNKVWLFSTQTVNLTNSVDPVSNEIIDGSTSDPTARIILPVAGSPVKAFLSGNVQGARSLTTVDCVPKVTSKGTLAQTSNLKFSTVGNEEKLIVANASAAADAGARIVAINDGTNSVNIVAYGTSHATLANTVWLHSAGAASSLVLGSGAGVERMRLKSGGNVNLKVAGLPIYANDAAASGAGLVQGDLYRVQAAGITYLCIVP